MASDANIGASSKPVIGQTVENLAAHGIPNIKRAKNIYRKCFWILAFLGGLSLFTLHCYNSIDKYIKHEITVNMDIEWQPRGSFPAVTICNLNPVKMSILNKFLDLEDKFGPERQMSSGDRHSDEEMFGPRMSKNMSGPNQEGITAERSGNTTTKKKVC